MLEGETLRSTGCRSSGPHKPRGRSRPCRARSSPFSTLLGELHRRELFDDLKVAFAPEGGEVDLSAALHSNVVQDQGAARFDRASAGFKVRAAKVRLFVQANAQLGSGLDKFYMDIAPVYGFLEYLQSTFRAQTNFNFLHFGQPFHQIVHNNLSRVPFLGPPVLAIGGVKDPVLLAEAAGSTQSDRRSLQPR